jgi:hypothetical protein
MNMDENKNHIKNKMGQQLPSHSPDPGTWQRLSAKLDALDAEAAYQEKLQGLPVHSPDQGTWTIIASRLNRIAYYKTGIRIALSAAAGLLLFFTVSRISDQYQTTDNNVPQVARQEQSTTPKQVNNQANPEAIQKKESSSTNSNSTNTTSGDIITAYPYGIQEAKKLQKQTDIAASDHNNVDLVKANQKVITVKTGSEITIPENATSLNVEVPAQAEITADQAIQNSVNHDETALVMEVPKSDTATRSILFQKEPFTAATSTPVKYYTPVKPETDKKANYFALAMGYLPENMDNGTNTSLFHNVDLTASYNKEKVRFNTSFGMAYNEEQLQFEVNYDINTPVTAMGPGGKLDTLSFNNASMESEYLGTEKHKYVTYNLGFGRRLFSAGKFSTWISAGAGFGIKLNEPDLIVSTANSVKGQYNAQNVSISSTGPVYNDVNVNFVTGIDFNYIIISKLSISFAPVSRWYFKPVLSKNNQATDELTLGFRTGLKFEF